MELIFYLIVILILLVTSLVLNENVKISGILNNIITRTIVLLGVVYTGNTRDYPYGFTFNTFCCINQQFY